jgi:hypothetical protein
MSTIIVPAVNNLICPDAGEWLLRSGIQDASGGVARYYLSDRGLNAPISTEITGYYANSLMTLYKQSGDSRYLEAAVKAAGYLNSAWDEECSAMPFECEGDDQKYSYFFDTGIIIRGLLAVWREVGTPRFLATAEKCGESMAEDFFDGKDFSPIVEIPYKNALPYEPARWSRSPGCYQLKAALGWYELWEATKQERYRTLYRSLLESALESNAYFLPGSDTDLPVMDRLHAYSYFLESLLPVIEEGDCARALASGIDRVAEYARAIAPKFLRSDVLAQVLRVRLFADQCGAASLDRGAAEEEVSLLKSFQSADADVRLRGGFWFGRKDGEVLPFMNPVSTAFSQQALEMWDRYQKGNRDLRWQSLI